MMIQLSEKEKQFVDQLQAADLQSIWGLAIKRVLDAPSREKLVQLKISILDQWRDNPYLMFKVLRFDPEKFTGVFDTFN